MLIYLVLSSCKQNTDIDLESQYKIKFEEARYVFHRAYFEKASVLFADLLKEKVDDPLAYSYMGVIDLMLYRDPSCNQKIADSLSHGKKDNYLFTQAIIQFINGDFGKCELLLKQHLTEDSSDFYARHVLGFTQIDADRPEDGVNTLSNLLETHPDYFPAYNHLGYGYLKLNEVEKALKAFEQFVKIDSLNPSSHDSFADGLAKSRQYALAISHLKRAVELEPGFAYGWKHLGDIYTKINSMELALSSYKKARDVSELYGESFKKSVEAIINKIK